MKRILIVTLRLLEIWLLTGGGCLFMLYCSSRG